MAIKDGWKPAEREIEGVLFDAVVDKAIELGFELEARDPGHVVLKREGSPWAIRADRFPLEVGLAESEAGVRARFRYAALVAFDTGDLERTADEFAAHFSTDRD